jgi:hypothetical protein
MEGNCPLHVVHIYVNFPVVRAVEFYRTPAGACPVEAFLDSLSDPHAQKVAWVLRLVESLERVPEQYLKKLLGTEDLWEVRIRPGAEATGS